MSHDHDLLVIGAGATGLAAARTARAAGRRVALVEAARPGGDCTHFGCVPSKTLLDVSHRVSAAREGRRLGVGEVGPVDFTAVMRHVQDVIKEVEQDESPELLRREGIDLLTGWARFIEASEDGCTVDVDGTRVRASRVVIASGAHAAVPPVDGLADVPYLTNATVFSLTERPEHLLVMGGGAIGVELAQGFSGLGTRVTLIEGSSRILGKEEPGVSEVMTRVLTGQGVDIRTGSHVASASARHDGVVQLSLADGSAVSGSHLLVAVGRRPATSGMDLDRVGIDTGQADSIVTDDRLRTTVPGVYAAGDCTTPLQFTHVGDAQGRLAASNAFARGRLPELLGGAGTFDPRVVPWVTFTDPEVGRVGLTEDEAYDRYGSRARVATVTMAETDRSRTAASTEGYIKIVVGPRRLAPHRLLDEVVGLTAVSKHGGELAHTAALAMRTRMLAARLAQTIAPYPTYSLGLRIAASRLFGTFGGQTWRPARPSGEHDRGSVV